MTDEERAEELVYELVDIAKDIRKVTSNQFGKKMSVTLLVDLGNIENKCLDAVKRLDKPKEDNVIIVTDADKKH